MKEFLRISMILLALISAMSVYGKRAYFSGEAYSKGDKYQSITVGDITISTTGDKIEIDQPNGTTHRTFWIKGGKKSGSDFTVTSKAGLIKYITISFNNGAGGVFNYSNHWKEWGQEGKTFSDGSYRYGHPTDNTNTDVGYWRCGDPSSAEEGAGKGGVYSYTFHYDKDTYNWKNKGSVEIEKMSVYYGDKIDNYITFTPPSSNQFSTDTYNVNLTDNKQLKTDNTYTIYCTTNGTTPTPTTANKYVSGQTKMNCTTKVQYMIAYTQPISEESRSDYVGLPESFTICSNVVTTQQITKYWPVTVGGTGGTSSNKYYYGTFCHNNIMRVPTDWTAYTLKGSKKTGGKIYYQTGKTYAQNTYIPANVPVIVVSSSEGSKNFTNPLYDKESSAEEPKDAEKCDDFIGNSGYSSKSLSASSTYYYYFLQPDDYSKVGMSFLWKTNKGNDATSVGQHKCYLQIAQSVAKAKAFSVEFLNPDDDTTTDITDIFTEPKAQQPDPDAPRYNLAGQVVGNDYKGIVIQNGRKFLAR